MPIFGIHGMPSSMPTARAGERADEQRDDEEQQAAAGAVAGELQHLGRDVDGAEHPGRDAEEEPHVRVLGDERQQHDQLHRVHAGLGQVERRADQPGDDDDHHQEPGDPGAADLLFEPASRSTTARRSR